MDKIMKKSDLYREWARVLDMCEGTNVKPEYCWKLVGVLRRIPPDFGASPKNYEFAVAILEDKPVFVGDSLWLKSSKKYADVSSSTPAYSISDKCCSWNPPKKTFNLNGVELPIPNCEDGYMFLLSSSDQKKKYYFDSLQDRNKFADAVINMVEDALKRS